MSSAGVCGVTIAAACLATVLADSQQVAPARTQVVLLGTGIPATLS